MPFDHRWAETLPNGLAHLHALAAALVRAPVVPDRQVRVWVTVPTTRLGVAAATLGALAVEPRCEGCGHAEVVSGARVSVYVNGRFEDTTVHVDGAMLRYSGVALAADKAVLHRLPQSWQDRKPNPLPEHARARFGRAYGCPPALAGRALATVSAHPVLLVGEPAAALADIEQLGSLTDHPDAGAWAAAANVHDWYRRPVLTSGRAPDLDDLPWLRDVRPRLVVVTTAAAAASPFPWQDVPVLSLLSRRSPSAAAAADRVHEYFAGPSATGLTAALTSALRPGNGLEVHSALALQLPTIDLVAPAAGQNVESEEVIW